MTKTTIAKIFLLLNMFVCFTQGAVVRNQVSQQFNNNIQENSLEESRYSSRSSSALNKKTQTVNYEQVSDLDNRVLDNFDHRYPDGSYEFRYELADGQARYERGYFITVNNHKSLVVVGYYSYRMPNGNYITVFYNADHNGYRQNQAVTRDTLPDLPRTIDVPEVSEKQSDDLDVTTKKSNSNLVSSTTKRNYF